MRVPRERIQAVIKQASFNVEKLREDLFRKPPGEVSQPKARKEKRLLNLTAETASVAEANVQYERIIQGNDLINFNYLEKGQMAGRAVGRIHVCDSTGKLVGYGTGFLVAPGVLLTNQHVLEDAAGAAVSFVEFDYELDVNGKDRVTTSFALEPDESKGGMFATSKILDYSCVAVISTAREGAARRLSEYGYLKLIAEEGKILVAEYVTIIQHPGGARKQVAIRENKVIRIDDKVAWYATDTMQGSSGSPVFNNSWQVVALHHLGVPKTDAQGNWLTTAGGIWNDSMDESQVDWIANEGIRISRVVADLKSQKPGHPLLAAVFDGTASSPVETVTPPPAATPAAVGAPQIALVPGPAAQAPAVVNVDLPGGAADIIVNVPLRISLAGGAATRSESPAQEKISIDPDYSTRHGYDPDFLSDDPASPDESLHVDLPALSHEMLDDVARLQDGSHELKYHHFSVVMNARRRVAFFTAVNIDGQRWKSVTREKDYWIYDPRVPKKDQAGDELYTGNELDRGHLVRRLDPAWGNSAAQIKTANDDTFHFTNCSPQHKDFNEGKTLWAGLEDYVLRNAAAKKFKVTVFTGPVFRPDDATHREVGVPKQFWKVIATVNEEGKLYSAAYLVSQAELIKDLPEEAFAYASYRTFQVRVADIEALSGLDFGTLGALDVFEGGNGLALERRAHQNAAELLPHKPLGWRMLDSIEELGLPLRTQGEPAPSLTEGFSPAEKTSNPSNRGRFSGNPTTEWLVSPAGPDRDMKLLAEFWYEDPEGKKWLAPAGSVIDGASIPKALWSSVGSPYTDDYRCASIVHDVACDTPSVPRKEADKMFYFACLAGGCSVPQARVLYAGVRIGAWSASLGGSFARRHEMLPFATTESLNQQIAVKSKFDVTVARIDAENHDLSFEELDHIVEQSLGAPI